jgi:hypothetical protein
METTRLTTAITAGCLMLMGAPALTPAFELRWRSVDNGGGYSTGGAFELEGTIGQPDAGFASGGGFELTGGFWFEQPLGDCDASGIVDLGDYADLAACLLGPDGGLSTGCHCFDFDADGDNDLVDFSVFQVAYQP